MKLYLLALTILITSCDAGPYKAPKTPPPNVDEKLWIRGRLLYQGRCVTCHNTNPDLAGSSGPRLRGVDEALLRDRLKNGKNGMPAQPKLIPFVAALKEYLK